MNELLILLAINNIFIWNNDSPSSTFEITHEVLWFRNDRAHCLQRILIVYHSNIPAVSNFDFVESEASVMCFKVNWHFTSKLWKQPLFLLTWCRKQTPTHIFCIFCSHCKAWCDFVTHCQHPRLRCICRNMSQW